jgi:hypothetical protein
LVVPAADGKWPPAMLNPELHAFYNPNGEIHGGASYTFIGRITNPHPKLCISPFHYPAVAILLYR